MTVTAVSFVTFVIKYLAIAQVPSIKSALLLRRSMSQNLVNVKPLNILMIGVP